MEKTVKKIMEEPKIKTIIGELAAYHRETLAHSVRVADLCAVYAAANNIMEPWEAQLIQAALLHDIGKLKIPIALIEKNEALTVKERSLLKQHAWEGARILSERNFCPEIVEGVHKHHENMDGSGYYGFKKEAIPLHARIIRIADSYSAMRENRAYSPALTHKEAKWRLEVRNIYDDEILMRFFRIFETMEKRNGGSDGRTECNIFG